MEPNRIALTLGIICIALTVSLAGTITNYSTAITTKDQTITNQTATISKLNIQVRSQLQTLVFHVSEKGSDYPYAQLPNASYTYNQIQALNKDIYQILLLPEYKGNENWQQELEWITNNFQGPQGIPIMLDVFGGGSRSKPTPMLTLEDIAAAREVANIKYLRFAEVLSWHIEKNQSFPTNYVADVLEYCRANNLRLLWTEWKNDYPDKGIETFTAIQEIIQGYEDIVTVSFSTNSQELEPTDGFLQLNSMFQNWGASIQAWYWNTTRQGDLMQMPPSLLLEHALSAKSLGAQTIEFEPYWYLFDNGQPNNSLELLVTNLTYAEMLQGLVQRHESN